MCQSLARMSLAVYSRCSLVRWISYISLCCMPFALRPWGNACLQATGFTRAALSVPGSGRDIGHPSILSSVARGERCPGLPCRSRARPKGLRTGPAGYTRCQCSHLPLCLPENHAWDLALVHAADQGFYKSSRSSKARWLVCSPRGDRVCGTA